MDKVIITAALTGAVTPKEKNASIPLTPEEIAGGRGRRCAPCLTC